MEQLDSVRDGGKRIKECLSIAGRQGSGQTVEPVVCFRPPLYT